MSGITSLKDKILRANAAYRAGNPIISDQAYDDICDELQKLLSDEEWTQFRSTLFETAGKVKHPYAMGSLAKFKAEEPENLCVWINEHIKNALNISAKVDGISCRLHYENGKLVSATTRGDGKKGENITDKIFKIRHVPMIVNYYDSLDIRGELVIFEDDFQGLDFANPRNATAGIIGRKEITDELTQISFVAYTVFGTKFTKKEQFEILERNGFFTAWHKSFTIAELQIKTAKGFENFNDELRGYVKQGFPYGVDGLVLSDDDYRNEDVLIPENQIAYKINELIGQTTVIDIDWRGPSKDGKIVPVAQLEPIELGGSVVQQCTLHNLDFIDKMGIKFGSVIEIIKSGDIIPKCIRVVENPANVREIEIPDECPCCGSKLKRDGVDLRCMNPNCDAQMNSALTVFIKKFEIKHSAKKQLDNFGIKTIDDLIAFLPNQAYKSEVTLYNELNDKLFSASPEKIFCAMHFKGLAEKQLNKIVTHYGLGWIMSLKLTNNEKEYMLGNLPSGIGSKLVDAFWDKLSDAIENTCKITSDSRYHYDETKDEEVVKNASVANRGSICFTGALETMGRKEAQALAESVGFEIKGGVNKGLTYLVMADPNSNSSKARKARELGTKCISEKEFLAMCKGEAQSLDDL